MLRNDICEAIAKVITENCDGTYNGLTESSTLCVDNPISFMQDLTTAVLDVVDKHSKE